MYKFVSPSEVISSKQIKTEIKLDINLLSKTNKYKTKQTNHERSNELPTPHLSFTALFITWMMYLAFRK
jgi:hypothetical protein